MNEDAILRLREGLSLPFDEAQLIQTNAYCAIYRAAIQGAPYIVKAYFGDDPALMRAEADALNFYHEIAGSRPDLIDSRTVARNDAQNLICIQFVRGRRLSDLIYQGRRNAAVREQTVRAMAVLGALLKAFYERTVDPAAEPDAFLFEYFAYCSNRLETLPALGRLCFRGYGASASVLADAFRAARLPPSFAHGDLVFRNIHVEGEQVGLVDFANTNFRSHILNDVYNLYFALANMVLSRPYKTALLDGLRQGTADLRFPDIGHRFYREYHRRRWLMLKLTSRHPRDLLQFVRGWLTFGRSMQPGSMPL
jgi:hypothetical protein